MGTLIKFALLILAFLALTHLIATWYPSLKAVAFSIQSLGLNVSWLALLVLVLIGGGFFTLKAK